MPLPGAIRLLKAVGWLGDRLGLSTPAIVDLTYLRSLPPGSFGRAWADHLDNAGLEPLDYGPRRQQLHDGLHVLTGYGTDPLGEGEVQAFLLGIQLRPIHGLLLLGVLRGLRQQRRMGDLPLSPPLLRQRLRQAYERGKRSRLNPNTWQPEALWTEPLADVRHRFHL
jgi:ubiquinone biosynthesis protein Coq4